ncbi:MAG: hypothetical protein QXX08_10135, partial [Candidatus Bathyarchaeia archaeon]
VALSAEVIISYLLSEVERLIIVVFIVVCIFICFIYGAILHREYKLFRSQAPGRNLIKNAKTSNSCRTA